SRGQITVVDRVGLENHICECYASIKKVYEGLLQ
ncbi:MAG TPA: Crp/Fnr family transcriptional regulator, partial [Herminiimonas sp.]|nr:Crp/Fnr family transcriptional regulator [Herminiimonas sp.]